MNLLDVNILVEAHRIDAPKHEAIASWLANVLREPSGVVVSDLVLSGFLCVVTHPRVFREPTPLDKALDFVADFRTRPSVRLAVPGSRHWTIFTDLLTRYEAKGNRIPDVYHAALALEYGYYWVSLDRGFSRYSELRWVHPLDSLC
ncbi:MAG: type II toxin-antitoxin system VapC family toxin [Verrucomicrobiota bacterium]